MAFEKFIVVYNKQQNYGQPENLTLAQAEAVDKRFTKAVNFTSVIYGADVAEIEAEGESQAVLAARKLLGATEEEGELLVSKASSHSKKSGR